MEKRRIISVEPEDLHEFAIEKKFVGAESITHEDIVEYVKILLIHIDEVEKNYPDAKTRAEQRRLVIINALTAKNVLHALFDVTPPRMTLAQLSKKEIEDALVPIRKAILEELKYYIDPDEYLLVEKQLNRRSRYGNLQLIKSAEGNSKKKLVHRDARWLSSGVMRRFNIAACERLQSLKEKNSHIVPIQSFDTTTGDMVTEHQPMENLWDLAWGFGEEEGLTDVEKRQESRRLLQVVADCLDGAAFLMRHKLVLQDIKMANLGRTISDQPNKRKGVLFDLDGLAPEGAVWDTRFVSPGYEPPEVDFMTPTAISHKEMAYQFGCVLELLIKSNNFLLHPSEMRRLHGIIDGFTAEKPSERMSVFEGYTALSAFITGRKKEFPGTQTMQSQRV